MKIILISLTLVAMASLLWFCKHQPKFTADNLPTKQLRWGKGGGFVGKETAYTLLENGQIFVREMGGALTESPRTKGKKALAAYKLAETLGLSKLDFNHPGNTYSFLEWQEGDAVKRIAWGDANEPVDGNLQSLFDTLNGLLTQKKN